MARFGLVGPRRQLDPLDPRLHRLSLEPLQRPARFQRAEAPRSIQRALAPPPRLHVRPQTTGLCALISSRHGNRPGRQGLWDHCGGVCMHASAGCKPVHTPTSPPMHRILLGGRTSPHLDRPPAWFTPMNPPCRISRTSRPCRHSRGFTASRTRTSTPSASTLSTPMEAWMTAA